MKICFSHGPASRHAALRSTLFHAMLAFAVALLSEAAVRGDETESDLSSELDEAKQKLVGQHYELRYKFQEGEEIRAKVVHLATTETKIQGNTQTSKSRSVSTKVWKVQEVDAEGNITFVHSVAEAEMWQKISDRPEIRFSSKSDEPPPPEYAAAAKTVGVPLATVTINPQGQVIERDNNQQQINIGLGQITLPLPQDPIQIGQRWTVPGEVKVRLPDLQVKRIKIRHLYELEKVQTGVATIQVTTQVLTPVNDPKVKSQLVQQLNDGTIKFDIDAGRVLAQQMDWDETVIGFNGADSIMKYLARFTEELQTEDARTAQRPAETSKQ